ncbi:MAG: excinuclease ABC subunit UvrC [Steroidobacteraceae bacterium]
MSAALFDPRSFVASLPRRPGVYRMYDESGELIYVGKATRLRDRVGSYFSKSQLAPKVAAMVKRIARIEVTVLGSETEALLQECALIKNHRPRYNILLRDDKSFPYILIPAAHPFPRLVWHRSARRPPPGRLFGPYPNPGAVKEVLQQLQKLFKLRNCRDSFFAHRTRPCLQHQIGRCSAPCVGLIDAADYGRDVEAAIAVLEGKSDLVSRLWRTQMEQHAEAREYEQAATLRDRLSGLQLIQTRQLTDTRRSGDVDVIALAGEPGQYAICVLPVRDGQTLGTMAHFPAHAVDEPGEALSSFLMLHYSRESPPAEVLAPLDEDSAQAVGAALSERAGRNIQVHRPQRGLGVRWLQLAEENAQAALRINQTRRQRAGEGLAQLAEVFHLPAAPERIECFDISHTMGEGTVASCVVLGPEGPLKKDYRRFNIEGITAGDDYGALHQALLRHGRRIVSGERPRPDLLLIDGGPGQVQAAADGLLEAGLSEVRLVGVSKGPERRVGQERLHLYPEGEIIALPPDSTALHLIQRARDEAHRFAITGHRRRRAARFRESILETVPGLGPARRRELLTRFGGLQGVLRAGLADLENTPGIGAALAASIYDHLHPGIR